MMKRLSLTQGGNEKASRLSSLALLIMLSLMLVLVQCDLCFTSQNLTKTSINCVYTYSYQCSPNPLWLSFQSCTYDNCTNYNNSTNNCSLTIRSNSSDFTQCNSQCNTNLNNSSQNQWTSILLIVLSIILLFIICYCIVRRCKSQPRDEFRSRPRAQGNQEFQLASHRHLNREVFSQTTLEWTQCLDLSKWEIDQETCAVCLDKGMNCSLPCNHYFHSHCIKQWLNVKEFCPICKSQEFTQLKLLCKTCRKKQLLCPVIHYTRTQISDICPTCL